MIHIHTDELLAAVSSLRAANAQVSDAAQNLLQITNHNDWTCKERNIINQNADNLRTGIKQLQQDTENYLSAAASAADAFVAEENGVKALFPGVDAIISKLLNISGEIAHEGSSGIGHGGSGHSLWEQIGTGGIRVGDIKDIIDGWDSTTPTPDSGWIESIMPISKIIDISHHFDDLIAPVPSIIDFSSLAY